jgi:hypothetical protein
MSKCVKLIFAAETSNAAEGQEKQGKQKIKK